MHAKRSILTSILISCGLLFAGAAHAQFAARIVYVGDASGMERLGAEQGLIEGQLTGQFLGWEFTMADFEPGAWQESDLQGAIAIVSAADENELLALHRAVYNVPVFNVSLYSDHLREVCYDNILHALPSDRMLRDAEGQWRQKHPDSDVRAQAWHPDFKKFAARDLNKRFLKRTGQKMDDRAWAAWAAVKMLTDAAVRENIQDAGKMMSFLRGKLSFDGQKGISFTFRPNGQLRQPLLLLEQGELVAEAPVRGVAKSLDSLGVSECIPPK